MTEKMEIRNLDFFYGNNHALHNINMKIADKSITSLIGPSG